MHTTAIDNWVAKVPLCMTFVMESITLVSKAAVCCVLCSSTRRHVRTEYHDNGPRTDHNIKDEVSVVTSVGCSEQFPAIVVGVAVIAIGRSAHSRHINCVGDTALQCSCERGVEVSTIERGVEVEMQSECQAAFDRGGC